MDRQKLARELADLPTSRLEQMYYPDAADARPSAARKP